MKTEQISVRVDHTTKAAAEDSFRELGIAPTEAVRLFYRQVVLQRGLPFAVRIPNKETLAAIKELDEGRGKASRNTEDFYKDLGL